MQGSSGLKSSWYSGGAADNNPLYTSALLAKNKFGEELSLTVRVERSSVKDPRLMAKVLVRVEGVDSPAECQRRFGGTLEDCCAICNHDNDYPGS